MAMGNEGFFQIKSPPPDESPPMKHNKNHDNAHNNGPPQVTVRFEFKHATALTVSVAGTFNDWQPATKSLQPIGSGHWLKETSLPPGIYEYCLVVDGKWIPDPLARETVPNPFGGRNSILKVSSTPEAARRAEAASAPLKNTNKPKVQRL